jgi:hypothetical protein
MADLFQKMDNETAFSQPSSLGGSACEAMGEIVVHTSADYALLVRLNAAVVYVCAAVVVLAVKCWHRPQLGSLLMTPQHQVMFG